MAFSRPTTFIHTHKGGIAALFGGILLPLVLFGTLAEDVWAREGFGWDTAILRTVHAHATPMLDAIMLFITRVGAPVALTPLIGIVLLILLTRDRRSDAGFVAVTVGGSALLNVGAKLLFQRARPMLWPTLRGETDYSFPSGHAMGSVALAGVLLALLWMTRWRWFTLALGAVVVALIGFSRIYLGAHYPSDILAGWGAAFAWVTGIRLLWYMPVRRGWVSASAHDVAVH